MVVRTAATLILVVVMVLGSLVAASADDAASAGLIAIPAAHDSDLKFYAADGSIVTGADALARMQEGGLTLWVAGNQFFAMDKVIGDFQHREPGLSVGLITLPPGLILSAILAGGWTYKGHDYHFTPDIYASVNLGHLKKLKAAGLMSRYAVYMHNELQIMVAKGNPKHVTAIDDLARADVRTSMPNPLSEGIMQFYARKVLERHGIWQKLSGGKECAACQTTENNWFTAVHHRETPERIGDGKSDAGIVWKTEGLEAQRHGAAVDTVELPLPDSLRSEVSYAIGALDNAAHRQVADRYLAFCERGRTGGLHVLRLCRRERRGAAAEADRITGPEIAGFSHRTGACCSARSPRAPLERQTRRNCGRVFRVISQTKEGSETCTNGLISIGLALRPCQPRLR